MNDLVPKRSIRKIIVVGVFALILLGSLGGNAYLFMRVRALSHPEQQSADELKQLVNDVSKVLVLPENETPTTATVTDPDKLKDQPFFAHAQVGDRVLIYQKSSKAILWRPSTHKVIEVSSINLPQQNSPTAGQ